MRDSVRAAAPGLLERFESRVRNMYLDTNTPGLVTCGIGNLIDPMASAFALPWLHKSDLTPATRADIVADWNAVKGAQSLRRLGGGHFAQLCKLILTDDAIDAIVVAKLTQIESVLRAGFGKWDSFPAPAQLAIIDMAWNMGPAFGFPMFRAACNTGDWAGAASQCHIAGAPDGRNAVHVVLFNAAATFVDPDALP